MIENSPSMAVLLRLNDDIHFCLKEYAYICANGPRPREEGDGEGGGDDERDDVKEGDEAKGGEGGGGGGGGGGGPTAGELLDFGSLGDSGTGGHMGVPGAITVIAPPPGQGVVDVMNQPIAPLTPPGEGGGRTRTRTRSGSGSVGTRSPVGPQGVAGQVRSQDRRYEEEETAVGNKKRERFVE